MKYFKGILTVGKKKKDQRERVIFTRGNDITTALDVARKIRYANWHSFKEINREEYVSGVQSRNY